MTMPESRRWSCMAPKKNGWSCSLSDYDIYIINHDGLKDHCAGTGRAHRISTLW